MVIEAMQPTVTLVQSILDELAILPLLPVPEQKHLLYWLRDIIANDYQLTAPLVDRYMFRSKELLDLILTGQESITAVKLVNAHIEQANSILTYQ